MISFFQLWIHGDSFIKGSSSLPIHNGKTLASHGDVIVVTFNYRLGALGFLASGDERIEGNCLDKKKSTNAVYHCDCP